MIGSKEGGGGVGKNENSIINTRFFSVYCSLLGLFRTKNIIRKRNGQVMNKGQIRPGRTFLQIQTDIYIYIFVKRCPLSFRLNTGISSQCTPIRGWVTDLFCVKTRGVGRGDFVTLNRVSCQKAVQSQINAVTHNHNTTSRDRGK